MTKSLPFKPLKKMRLYEEVAEQIKQSIFDGQFQPGDRLPSERELCQIFNVGRPAVREALRTLSVMGLVDVQTGRRGSTVKNYDINEYVEAMRQQLVWLIRVEEKTIVDLWEFRRFIELGIAQLAARNATQEDLRRLDHFLKRMVTVSGDVKAYFPIGLEFHKELALCTRNKIFFLIWELISDLILKGYVPHLEEIFPDGPAKVIDANKVLLKAIKSKDSRTIERAVEFHAKAENKIYLMQSRISKDAKSRLSSQSKSK